MDRSEDAASVSDTDMLFSELKAEGLAARLLSAWKSSEPHERRAKLLETIRNRPKVVSHAAEN